MQNVEIEVVGVKGHPRPLAMSPFATSYLTSTETMHLSCTIFKLSESFVKSHKISNKQKVTKMTKIQSGQKIHR